MARSKSSFSGGGIIKLRRGYRDEWEKSEEFGRRNLRRLRGGKKKLKGKIRGAAARRLKNYANKGEKRLTFLRIWTRATSRKKSLGGDSRSSGSREIQGGRFETDGYKPA